jgi:hypothetical protein
MPDHSSAIMIIRTQFGGIGYRDDMVLTAA